jgi:hypothetical protein
MLWSCRAGDRLISRRRERTESGSWRVLAGPHTTVLPSPLPGPFSARANPGWKVVVPLAGQVRWQDESCRAHVSPAVVFPPETLHRVLGAAGGFAVHVDAWYLGLGPPRHGAVPLGRDVVAMLRELLRFGLAQLEARDAARGLAGHQQIAAVDKYFGGHAKNLLSLLLTMFYIGFCGRAVTTA